MPFVVEKLSGDRESFEQLKTDQFAIASICLLQEQQSFTLLRMVSNMTSNCSSCSQYGLGQSSLFERDGNNY